MAKINREYKREIDISGYVIRKEVSRVIRVFKHEVEVNGYGCVVKCISDEDFDEVVTGVRYVSDYEGIELIERNVDSGDDLYGKCYRLSLLGSGDFFNEYNEFEEGKLQCCLRREGFGFVYYGYSFYDGRLDSKEYYNSKMELHNELGYAVVNEYYGNGVARKDLYYLRGKLMDKVEWEAELLVKLYW